MFTVAGLILWTDIISRLCCNQHYYPHVWCMYVKDLYADFCTFFIDGYIEFARSILCSLITSYMSSSPMTSFLLLLSGSWYERPNNSWSVYSRFKWRIEIQYWQGNRTIWKASRYFDSWSIYPAVSFCDFMIYSLISSSPPLPITFWKIFHPEHSYFSPPTIIISESSRKYLRKYIHFCCVAFHAATEHHLGPVYRLVNWNL